MTHANKMSADNSIIIFDRERVRHNRNRALPEHNFLMEWAGKQITDRLRDVTKNFPLALQMGLRTPQGFADDLAATGKIETLIGMDTARKLVKPGNICADEEFLPFKDQSLDLVINVMGLHSTNDLPGTLIQIRRALKPDGLFLAALFGGESLMELRQSLMQTEIEMKGGMSPRVFPFRRQAADGRIDAACGVCPACRRFRNRDSDLSGHVRSTERFAFYGRRKRDFETRPNISGPGIFCKGC
jgi:SAM-dependent methyltransferase